MSYRMKSKFGTIHFSAEGTPAQCGMTFICNVAFRDVKDKDKLYDFFLNEVIFGKKNIKSIQELGWTLDDINRENGRWNVNKYLMTDYKKVEGRHTLFGKANLYDFCKTMGALEGDLVPNPNSGNEVRTFEFNRKSIKEEA